MKIKALLIIITFGLFSLKSVYSQINATIIGDAIDLGGNCYVITQDLPFQSGGVWYNNPINFDSDFTIYYQNNFGSRDTDGADGMALVFKRNPNAQLGNSGGGMGYQGISQSLSIEFDTFQNNSGSFGFLGDPGFDHIAIQRDGNPFHNNPFFNLAGPIQASATSQNIEDGIAHEVKIEWIAATTTLNVYFDCALRISLVEDVKNTVFSNDDSVFFGFVGSTGGSTNIHQVCFNRISFIDNLQLQDQTICENGSASVNATTPSGVTYSWSPTNGVSNPNIPNPALNPLVTTTYTVTIGDVCGDTFTEDVTIIVEPNITPTFDAVPAICSGASLAALPTTSINSITGSWSPALDNTATTTYTFTPDTGQGCVLGTTIEIVVNPNITPTFDAVPAICSGASLAALPTTSTNGITGTWSPALDNTTTTTYTFTPDTGQGCVLGTTIEIVVNPNITPTFAAVPAICSGASLAPLPTTSTNGVTGSWSPALDNTTTTTYTFTPDTGQGCVLGTTIEIVVNPNITPTFDAVPAICSGASLAALPTTSTNGITGTWSPALDNTTTTTYTFTPDTGQDCALSTTLEIVVNPNITPTFAAVPAICSGASLAALPTTSTNGVTGVWSPALDNTTTTTYTFTPDTGQCSTTTTLEIIVNPNITPTFAAVPSICSGTSLAALPTTSTNGVTGIWSPALDNTTTTTYTFTPDTGQDCVLSTTLEIVVNPNITPTFAAVPSICSGASLAALPTTSINGVIGTWSPALDNTATTTYTFTPDTGQCSTTTTLEIIVNPNITPTFAAVPSICSGASLAALPTTSTNGVTGIWSPALDNTATTTYTFTPDTGQCSTTTTLEIIVNPNITPTFAAVPSICSGASLVALPTTSTNGVTGTWSPALDNTTTTTYTFTPDTGQDCVLSTTLEIIVNPNITPTFAAVPSICSGASLAALPATSTNGITGVWSPALDNTATTTYTFTPDTGQCSTITTLEIIVNPNITPTFAVVPSICSGDSLAALPTTSTNGVTGIWSPALDNTVTTTYTFTPDSGQCSMSATLEIIVNPNITPTFAAVPSICSGASLAALPTTSTNGVIGTWSPALDNTTTTTYTFTPDTGQGCILSTTLEIEVFDLLIPTFDDVPAICSGASLAALPTISTNGITGTWSPALNNAVTTTYTFTPNIGQGCYAETSLEIEVIPISDLQVDVIVNSEDFADNQVITVNVTGGTGNYLYRLGNGPWQESNIFTNINSCINTVFVSEVSGCSNASETSVRVINYPKYFTPNGDSYNETWNIFCLDNNPSAIISIFDRYGKLLKQISPRGLGWDGTYNGSRMPTNAYWFLLEYIDNEGIPKTFSSHFTLKR